MSLNRASMSSLLRKNKLSGSYTHGSLQSEPSFKDLHASHKQTHEGLPHDYQSSMKPTKSHEIIQGKPTHDESFHEPLEFGPNYQHSLAKDHFATGGHAAGGKWIQSAIEHPGGLHKSLHIKQGQKIPVKKIEQAENARSPLIRKQARLAMTLKGFNHRPQGR